jgi:hypothetical protein
LNWVRYRFGRRAAKELLWRISFYSVLFRLSTGKKWDRGRAVCLPYWRTVNFAEVQAAPMADQ